MRALTLGSREGRTNERTFGTEKLKLSTLVYTTNFVGKVFSARNFFLGGCHAEQNAEL